MEITKETGRVIGTQWETYLTLIIRQNGEHWRLVTAYPKIIKVKEEIDWDEYDKKYLVEQEEEDEEEEELDYDTWEHNDENSRWFRTAVESEEDWDSIE